MWDTQKYYECQIMLVASRNAAAIHRFVMVLLSLAPKLFYSIKLSYGVGNVKILDNRKNNHGNK